jgi:hypothetical protein
VPDSPNSRPSQVWAQDAVFLRFFCIAGESPMILGKPYRRAYCPARCFAAVSLLKRALNQHKGAGCPPVFEETRKPSFIA